MTWVIKKYGEIVSTDYATREEVVASAIEKGFALQANGKVWVEEGITFIDRNRVPLIGDETWEEKEGKGKISYYTQHRTYVWIEFEKNEGGFYIDPRDLRWDMNNERWIYPPLQIDKLDPSELRSKQTSR
jgi:hypothetical protein